VARFWRRLPSPSCKGRNHARARNPLPCGQTEIDGNAPGRSVRQRRRSGLAHVAWRGARRRAAGSCRRRGRDSAQTTPAPRACLSAQ
jgi:hypothetical protein